MCTHKGNLEGIRKKARLKVQKMSKLSDQQKPLSKSRRRFLAVAYHSFSRSLYFWLILTLKSLTWI